MLRAGFLVALLVGLLAPFSALAVENGGIGGKPARPRSDNPRTESIFVHEIEPGSSVGDAVQIINNTDTDKTLLVYAVDSQTASGGGFACAQQADESLGVGTWITLEKDRVTLGPNSSTIVPFMINAPSTASAGEHNGCIVIQDAEQAPADTGNGIALSFRTAIRVAITIPGEITKELSFTGVSSRRLDNGLIRLSAALKNNGNVSLDSDVHLSIKSFFGQTVRSAGGEFPILARSDAAFNFEVKKPFWGGWYTVVATATYNADKDQSLGQAGEKKTITSTGHRIFVAPEPQALLIELLALALLISALLFATMRKRFHAKALASSKTYKVKAGDTLQTIAKKHNVSWKRIARLNRLRAPYHVEANQELKIPANQRKKE
jgi:nucleoid-associated protein YgaU